MTKKTSKNAKATKRQRAKRQRHESSWELYHFIIAAGLVFGFVAASHGLSELIERLHGLSKLEESGLVAAMVVMLRGMAIATKRVVDLVSSFLS